MTIETKYNIGDEVWFMADNKAHKAIIYGFLCEQACHYIKDGEPRCVYTNLDYIVSIDQGGHTSKMYDCDLFPSKEELLKSL
jgi:hypothetical protein